MGPFLNKPMIIGSNTVWGKRPPASAIFRGPLLKTVKMLQDVREKPLKDIIADTAQGLGEFFDGRALVYLLNDNGKIEVSEGYQMSADESHLQGKFPEGVMQVVIDQMRSVYIENILNPNFAEVDGLKVLDVDIVKRDAARFGEIFSSNGQLMDMAVIPLIDGEEVIGVVRVDCWNTGKALLKEGIFVEDIFDTVEFFTAFATQAITIRSLLAERERSFAWILHEIKTKMASAGGFARLLLKQLPDIPEIQRKFLGIIYDDVQLAEESLSVNVAAIRDGDTLVYRKINFHRLIKDIVDLFPEDRIKVELDPEIMFFNTNKKVVRAVVEQLLENALKYSADDVVIKTEKHDKHLIISVVDKGLGVPKDKLTKLFTESTGTDLRIEKSTGMGLYTIYPQIERMNGKIVCDSIEGEGSTFSLVLPLS